MSDLTFLTNQPGQGLLERLQAILKEDTRLFDCLVGYFYVSGFFKLAPHLEKVEKIRILVGLRTDDGVFKLLQAAEGGNEFNFQSHAQIKETYPRLAVKELEGAEDQPPVETGVRQFIEWVRSGKLEIRVYPAAPLHAKIYIMTFHEGDRDKGRIITGSSNLTQGGLVSNLEFNVELKTRADYEFALQQFNNLWSESVDVTPEYVQTLSTASPFANFTPYELYLKFLYEYFRGDLSRSSDDDSPDLPGGFKRLKYQEDAVSAAIKILEEHGGLFLSDVVGLGKTYMSALLARRLSGRALVLAPPALLDKSNPGSWPNVFGDFRVPQAEFESIGKLDDLLSRGVDKFSTIFIDEAHRFRTDTTQTYEKLSRVCRGKKVVLVTATPLNNSPQDILAQIKLFQPGRNSTIPNMRHLDAFFKSLEANLRDLDRQDDRDEYMEAVKTNAKAVREKILKYLMIRRTRSEVAKYYRADLETQGLRFPDVADPVPLFYGFSKEENAVFSRTMRLIAGEFSFARYRPLTYSSERVPDFEFQSQLNLAKFMRILLVKRLESSVHAFRNSLDRFQRSYERFIAEFRKGYVYISRDYTHKVFDLLDAGEEESLQRLLDEDKAQKIEAAKFNKDLSRDLERDLEVLKEIQTLWATIKRDPKWDAFKKIIQSDSRLSSAKTLIFTESKETAAYLADRLKSELKEDALLFTGDSDESLRKVILQNFDPRSTNSQDGHRLLVATDVLAEGVNLHRANVVVNYDIPWNPTRLIQRVGRVNRVGTAFDTIHTYNFFPTEESNDEIKLKEAAETKIHAFIEMLGSDARLLTEGEEIKSHDLFTLLNSKKTITGEEEAESPLEYLDEIRRLRDTNPALFERIKRLPKKARAVRRTPEGKGLLTYFRKGGLDKFFWADDAQVLELDFFEAAKKLKPRPDEPAQPVPSDYYPLLDKNKRAFQEATDEESIVAPGNNRDSALQILRLLRSREVRTYQGFTEDDEAFLAKVADLVEAGSLPRPTARTLVRNLEGQTEPLKIRDILRRGIPPEFLRQQTGARSPQADKPREVILSAFFAPLSK
jgi:superfamily II DNA or RNA helicase